MLLMFGGICHIFPQRYEIITLSFDAAFLLLHITLLPRVTPMLSVYLPPIPSQADQSLGLVNNTSIPRMMSPIAQKPRIIESPRVVPIAAPACAASDCADDMISPVELIAPKSQTTIRILKRINDHLKITPKKPRFGFLSRAPHETHFVARSLTSALHSLHFIKAISHPLSLLVYLI